MTPGAQWGACETPLPRHADVLISGRIRDLENVTGGHKCAGGHEASTAERVGERREEEEGEARAWVVCERVKAGERGVYPSPLHGLSSSAPPPWLPPRWSRLLPESDSILLPIIAKQPGEAAALGVARVGDLEGVELALGWFPTSRPPGVRFG